MLAENRKIFIILFASLAVICGIIGFAVVEEKNFYDTVMGIVDLLV